MSFIPDIEKKPLAESKLYQEKRLREVILYVAKNSPFYKRHFAQHKIDPSSINKIEDLQSIPVTSKDDLQKHNWDFACVAKNSFIEFTSTSGTLGKPVTIGLTKADVERLAYNEFLSFTCADGTADDRYQLMLTLDRQFMAGIAYYEGIRKLGAGVIRLGPGSPAMQLECILRLEPTTLVVVPSFLIKLIDFAKEQGIDLNKTSVKKIVCIGESLRTQDHALNVLGNRIMAAWNITLFGTYAATEMQTSFTECLHGIGAHHHPELIIVELLDNKGNVVAAGKQGEVTITTLGVEGMPLIRYATGDMATYFDEPCNCGRATIRLGPVIGRKQQMIKLKGTTFYPPAVFEILNNMAGVVDYVVEVNTNSIGTDDLLLYLLVSDAFILQMVKDSFQSGLRVVPEIKIVEKKMLEQFQLSAESRKVKRFLDKRIL